MNPLTPSQITTLTVVVDRLIPPDADYPGGAQAGVADYLVRQLTPPRGDFADQADAYRAFLDALESEDFTDLSPDAQDARLARAEADPITRDFFRRLVEQAQEGFYADPGNGGNRDRIAWKMIGFEVTA